MKINPHSGEDRKNAMAAIMAAITDYIEEEEKARLVAASPRKTTLVLSLWRVSGREEVMRMRTLWQLRIV